MDRPAPAALPWRSPGSWLRLASLGFAYVLLAQLGLQFALPGFLASPVWPPTGLAIAAVALWGAPAALPVFAGAVYVESAASGNAWAALGMGVGNSLEALAGGLALRRLGGSLAFGRLRGVAAFAGIAAAAPLASATFGVGSLLAVGTFPAAAAPHAWWTWYLGDVAGALVLVPVLLLSAERWDKPWRRSAAGEGVAAVAALFASAALLFGLVPGVPAEPALVVLMMPPLVWVGFRLGPRPAALALLALDALAVGVTRAGQGPFVADSPNASFLLLQAFVVTVGLMVLGLAALALERNRAAAELEARVAERTRRLDSEVRERRTAQAESEEAQRIAQMGTWWWDVSKPNAEWSPELYRIYGLDPATHVPTYEDYLTRVHPDDRERVRRATEEVFTDHKPYSHDERVRRPDGSWRHLHTWARAVLGPDGKLVALSGACQDITDRVAQEGKFRSLLESAPDAMVIVDKAGQVVLVNSQAEKLFGYPRSELLGNSIEMLVPELSKGVHSGHRERYADHPRPRAMGAGLDLRARRKDGSEFPVEISLSPLETPEGLLVSSAIRDVTQRRRDAQMLAESLERFRALADASPIGIVHTTSAGVVDYANQAWLRILSLEDYRDPEAVRRAVHPEDQPKAADQWRQCVKEGLEFDGEMRFVRPDGSVRLTRSRAVPVRDHDGAISGFVSAVQDITELRAAEEMRLKEQAAQLEVRRLREQADFKTNFLRTAAHELGTPLTPLKIQLRVLRDLVKKRPDPEEARAVAILDRNVDRLQVLVKDLLESARLQSGRLKLNARSMDLSHAVHDVVETFQEPAIATGIALDAQVPSEMAMVGDPDRITQVLYNLISNAMKFTPAGGRVHVVAEDLGDVVRFEVQDTGAGFTPEQASHLFQPFSQVHDLMQTSKPGSGLGLYICKGIVEQHGGQISAHSEGPGKGARFTVSMPRVARPQPAPAAEARLPEPRRTAESSH